MFCSLKLKTVPLKTFCQWSNTYFSVYLFNDAASSPDYVKSMPVSRTVRLFFTALWFLIENMNSLIFHQNISSPLASTNLTFINHRSVNSENDNSYSTPMVEWDGKLINCGSVRIWKEDVTVYLKLFALNFPGQKREGNWPRQSVQTSAPSGLVTSARFCLQAQQRVYMKLCIGGENKLLLNELHFHRITTMYSQLYTTIELKCLKKQRDNSSNKAFRSHKYK